MKNFIKTLASFCIAILVLFPIFVTAQSTEKIIPVSSGGPVTINFKIDNPFKGGSDLTNILNTFLEKIIMPIAAVCIVLAIIYSGFKFVMAQGDPGEIKKAREGLMYVLIGAAILLGATGISLAIKGTLSQLFN